ncbi:MAG: hypothetical protein QME58_03710 [Bacteroidota bacterium]|nr:hypothetical protein [Bacteroidota bacterium]
MVISANSKLKIQKAKKILISHRSRFFALGFLLIAFSFPLLAQEVHVSARVDSNNILIGDWLKLHIELEYPPDAKISYPAILDSLEGLELIERTQPAITKSEIKIIEKTVLIISAYDTGTFVIPSLDFGYILKNDTSPLFASTFPIPIFVHSVGVDQAQEIKDIKPPLSVPITFAEILPYLFGLIVAILISFFIFYFIKKRQQKNIWKIFSEPKRSAHEIAIDALKSLEAEKLWQRGEVKLYHSKLTDIVRTYIEDRFNIKAMESTTDEILADFIHHSEFNGELQTVLKKMLTLADFVKFAKQQPLPDENDLSIRQAFEFVEKTIPLKSKEEKV